MDRGSLHTTWSIEAVIETSENFVPILHHCGHTIDEAWGRAQGVTLDKAWRVPYKLVTKIEEVDPMFHMNTPTFCYIPKPMARIKALLRGQINEGEKL